MNKLKYVLGFFLGLVIIASSIEKSVAEFEESLIPRFRPFGTSTSLTDSTNWVILNKSFMADSIMARKDLTVLGLINLDTNKMGTIHYDGFNMVFNNDKTTGNMTFQLMNDAPGTAGDFTWLFGNVLSGTTYMTLDSATGLTVNQKDIKFNNAYTTQQVKINGGDSAFTDYDANDAITCNLQSGRLTTKSLTTAAGSLYALTLTNSLITANSKIFASLNDGTSTQGLTLLYQCRPGSGSGTIVIYNGHSADAFNGTLIIYFFIVNSP